MDDDIVVNFEEPNSLAILGFPRSVSTMGPKWQITHFIYLSKHA